MLSEPTIGSFTEYLDSAVCANLPYKEQVLLHIRSIHIHGLAEKITNHAVFIMVIFLLKKTIIARPVKATTEFEKYQILKRREDILSKVQNYINSFFNPNKESYVENTTIYAVLKENDNYWALAISADSDYQIHLRKDARSYFVNNYHTVLSKSWRANIDLQPVINHYNAVAYMAAYFSKSEQETSEALRQAEREIEI